MKAVALSEAAQDEIILVAGADADAVSFLKDGTVVITATAEQLAGNEGLSLLQSLVASDKVFGLVVGPQVDSASGPLSLAGGRIENLSHTPDDRLASLGLTQLLPPEGFDGLVGIGLDAATLRTGKENGLPANRTLIVFHELAENFYRTEGGLQYAPAHEAAARAETELRGQRPELGSFAFGAGPDVKRTH